MKFSYLAGFDPGRPLLMGITAELWFAANRLGAFALLYLLDDPAILAMTFC